jgi:ribosomal protein L7Ae-like RNA K-turn-binding protein
LESNKTYSYISLCAKAGRLVSGNFAVEKAVKERKACLVIVSCDASKNTRKLFDQKCNYYQIPVIYLGDKETLGKYTGNEMRTSIAILDENFANQIIKAHSLSDNMEG